MAITVPVSEACYRFVESPIRTGALARWWADRERVDWGRITACGAVSALSVAGPLALFYRAAPATFDAAVDTGNTVVFHLDTAAPSGAGATIPAAPAVAAGPRRIVVVGDSTAHALAVNLPSGIERTFAIGDGSITGCSVYDNGTAVSSHPYTTSFDRCAGWQQKWSSAARKARAQIALVVLGAWDVFDVKVNGQTLKFGSQASDQRFIDGVQKGIAALTASGVKVALLEVPCMRPKDVKGAGVPALAERGNDQRVAHVNDLLRKVAAANPVTTVFVSGPQQYCTDPSIATSLAYRWDGVHAYKPGAELTFSTIAPALLSLKL
jgi:hypothetical protein